MNSILGRILDDKNYRNKLNSEIKDEIEMISGSVPVKKKKKSSSPEIDLVQEIARTRFGSRGKYTLWKEVFLDRYSLSYSTPEIVGVYRGKRLSGNRILDLGCGAGMQTIMLSKESSVTGVDIDPDRIIMAKLNSIIYNSNANFVVGDAMNYNIEDNQYDIIFSDPLRPPNSSERTLEELEPNPSALIEKYGGIVRWFVFDLPPFIKRDKLEKFHGTLEYLSVNGDLNRLTMYYEKHSQKRLRAVILPSGFEYESDLQISPKKTEKMLDHLYVPDASLFYSGLHGNYCKDVELANVWSEKRKAIYTSREKVQNFAGEIYNVLESCDHGDLMTNPLLKQYKHVFFRYSLENYYAEKRKLEQKMNGDGNIYIFRNNNRVYLCDRLIQ